MDFLMTATTEKKKKGKRFPHATQTFNMEMVKTLFSQHTNVHNSCCGNYAVMAEKKHYLCHSTSCYAMIGKNLFTW